MRNALVVGLVVLGACGSPAPAPALAPVSNTTAAPAEPGAPLALVLVVDRSGSMTGMKLDETRHAAAELAAKLPAGSEFGLIAFDTTPLVLVQLTTDADAIALGIERLEAGGGTVFLPALISAREMLAGSAAERKHVIFLSDGQAAYEGVEDAARALRDDGATVTTVGIPEADQQLLDLIAQRGGGRAIALPDIGGLSFALAHELEYVIGR
jgi:Ca-activated chloride channel homolog